MNNFIKSGNGSVAFIFKGMTFEMNESVPWYSIKTCIDPTVTFQINKNGMEVTEMGLSILAHQVIVGVNAKTDVIAV